MAGAGIRELLERVEKALMDAEDASMRERPGNPHQRFKSLACPECRRRRGQNHARISFVCSEVARRTR